MVDSGPAALDYALPYLGLKYWVGLGWGPCTHWAQPKLLTKASANTFMLEHDSGQALKLLHAIWL